MAHAAARSPAAGPRPRKPARSVRPSPRASTAARRTAIAEAARALIVEKGFEGLRTRDIAERVGINIATLHYHVPTKQALVELVSQSLQDDFAAQYAARHRAGLGAAERLRLELADYAEVLFGRPEIHVVFAELGARARHDAAVGEIMARMRADWRAHYAAILEDGRTSGEFRADLDPEAAAMLITAALVGARAEARAARPRFKALVAEILRAVRRPDGPGQSSKA